MLIYIHGYSTSTWLWCLSISGIESRKLPGYAAQSMLILRRKRFRYPLGMCFINHFVCMQIDRRFSITAPSPVSTHRMGRNSSARTPASSNTSRLLASRVKYAESQPTKAKLNTGKEQCSNQTEDILDIVATSGLPGLSYSVFVLQGTYWDYVFQISMLSLRQLA
jgi:hypothetical protein